MPKYKSRAALTSSWLHCLFECILASRRYLCWASLHLSDMKPPSRFRHPIMFWWHDAIFIDVDLLGISMPPKCKSMCNFHCMSNSISGSKFISCSLSIILSKRSYRIWVAETSRQWRMWSLHSSSKPHHWHRSDWSLFCHQKNLLHVIQPWITSLTTVALWWADGDKRCALRDEVATQSILDTEGLCFLAIQAYSLSQCIHLDTECSKWPVIFVVVGRVTYRAQLSFRSTSLKGATVDAHSRPCGHNKCWVWHQEINQFSLRWTCISVTEGYQIDLL